MATSVVTRRTLSAVLPSAMIAATVLVAGGPAAETPLVDPDNGICPPAYELVDYARVVADFTLPTSGRERNVTDPAKMVDPTCMLKSFPESIGELQARDLAEASSLNAPATALPAGAYLDAFGQAQALEEPAAQAAVPGIAGTWGPYGQGNLIGDDPQYVETAGQGLTDLAGRIDSLVFDDVSGRLFAAGGTSGIWMSEDLANSWVSIGDNLPSVANGAIAWTSGGGGTLVALSGEPTFGGNLYAGVGAFWTNDLGETWNRAEGVPEGAMGFAVEPDLSDPDVVYVATSLGLYRSADAGRTFQNVNLPTSPECAGNQELGNVCDTANVVTDVMVMIPGGTTNEPGGQVIAAVGHRNDQKAYPTGETRSPGQGLYFSETGEVDSFERLDLISTDATGVGFASPERQGRVEFGQASGPAQDHNYIYAIVADSVNMAGGSPIIDVPEAIDQEIPDPRDIAGDLECENVGLCIGVFPNSNLNGVYASPDFGQTWIRMADDAELAENPATGSALGPVRALIAVGVQAWYNEWIEPDPTRADPVTGAPTRLLFGLEEIWSGTTQTGVPYNGAAQQGPSDFRVVGRYFGGERCAFLDNPVPTPACPFANPVTTDYTTHPDQHDALWVPSGDGGVILFVANDGGVYRAGLEDLEDVDNTKWTPANTGMNTLLPYSVAVSEDGTVYLGLQDNGTAKIDPETGSYSMVFVGDGTGATVDPFESDIAMAATPAGNFNFTVDGGKTYNSATGVTAGDIFQFVTPWVMDPTDEYHILTAGTHVYSNTSGQGGGWRDVFDLGSPESQPEVVNVGTAMAGRGDAEYVGYCGVCDPYRNPGFRFLSGIATNVGADEGPLAGEADGWHHATAAGLPERYITSLLVGDQPETVYATLGGYAGRRWAGIDTYTDPDRGVNSQGGNVYMSTDAGETFVDISNNLPDIRANWIIQRGSQLLVATDVGVFMSSDMQGTTWAKLAGLPNHPVKMIQLRPEHPEELFAAVYGRSIWRYTFSTAAQPATAPTPEPVEPAPAPLPATGGGAAVAGLVALGAWSSRRRRGLIG